MPVNYNAVWGMFLAGLVVWAIVVYIYNRAKREGTILNVTKRTKEERQLGELPGVSGEFATGERNFAEGEGGDESSFTGDEPDKPTGRGFNLQEDLAKPLDRDEQELRGDGQEPLSPGKTTKHSNIAISDLPEVVELE